MSSSGCATAETLNLQVKDLITSVSEYYEGNDIYDLIDTLKGRDDIVPTFQLKRRKTGKNYFTFCSPEAFNEICIYLLTRKSLRESDRLFKITQLHLMQLFREVNNLLGLGTIVGILQMTGKGGFRLDRISTYFNPWADAQGTGYQMVQSLYAIGSGGFFGVGLGESKQKYLYIPEPHNDFIFAILAEELGFLGCFFVIALFAIFIWRGILVAMRAPDVFGSLMAIGITTLIGAQAIINIAVVTASIPTTGMALPFFSYGGTALLILLCNVGILLNISRAGSKV